MILVRLLLLAAALLTPATAAAAQAASQMASSAEVQRDHVSIRTVGAGDPVVLIPGLATPRAVFDGIAADLARTHRVLLVQVNGFGGDAPLGNARPGVIAGVTADIAAHLEREGLPKAAVIGHSMGGVIGMRLARDHPQRVERLMVVDSLPFFGSLSGPDATVDMVRSAAEAMRARILAAPHPRRPSADDPSLATMSITPAGRLQVSTWSVAARPHVVAQAMYETMAEDLRPDLPAIARVPTTVLHAVPPQIAERARALWAREYAPAPSIRLIGVENSHHFIMIDQPERFAREVAAFLAR